MRGKKSWRRHGDQICREWDDLTVGIEVDFEEWYKVVRILGEKRVVIVKRVESLSIE